MAKKTTDGKVHIIFYNPGHAVYFATSDGRRGSNPTLEESEEVTVGRILQSLNLQPGTYTAEYI